MKCITTGDHTLEEILNKKKPDLKCKRCGKNNLKEYNMEHTRTLVCDKCFFPLFNKWFKKLTRGA